MPAQVAVRALVISDARSSRAPDSSAAERPRLEGIQVSTEEIVDIIHSLKKGKTGAQDGVLVDFLQGTSPERKSQLADLVRDRLREGPAPQGWRTASVTLIPKIEVPLRSRGLSTDHGSTRSAETGTAHLDEVRRALPPAPPAHNFLCLGIPRSLIV